MLKVGIVGLPNVGKSTLFNALLKKQAALAANYPFATVEPNVGIVEVKDGRLTTLAKTIAKANNKLQNSNNKQIINNENSKQQNNGTTNLPPIVPATIEFVDIAGLVAGAAQGEGLGNKFLANIRETNLICHVLRAFKDEDVVITGKMNPQEDLEIVRTELILKDLETVEKQDKSIKKLNDKTVEATYQKALQLLKAGKMINSVEWSDKELEWLKTLHLLTAKPEIVVLNVSEEDITKTPPNPLFSKEGESPSPFRRGEWGEVPTIPICAKVEAELAELSSDEQTEYLHELGLTESGIEKLAKAAYQTLGLISFLTAGEKECRAWTVKQGTNAQQAAGVIHQDFIKNFIKAKVCTFSDFIAFNGWKGAAEAGKVRSEGRDYIIQDGDVVEFMIGK